MRKASFTRMTVLMCFLLVATPSLYAEDRLPFPQARHEKESYSIGYQVGRSMTVDGVEVDFEELVQGLRDAVDGNKPRLSDQEMRQLIVDLKKRAREAQLRKVQDQMVKNAQESEKFLAENGKQEGVQTRESGLQYKVLKEGEGKTPGRQDYVEVNYIGTFVDGMEFDSSYAKGEPARVRADGVIKGWTEALTMMKEGAKWRVFVPPDLAYGRGGLGGRIPPNKLLVFDIELLSVEDTPKAEPAYSQAGQTPTEKKMTISGEIAKAEHGYVIRAKRNNVPTEIYTILNPEPRVLDALIGSGKTVPVEARIVSGDNVEIEKIGGKKYP